jgi:hypothetical protein
MRMPNCQAQFVFKLAAIENHLTIVHGIESLSLLSCRIPILSVLALSGAPLSSESADYL